MIHPERLDRLMEMTGVPGSPEDYLVAGVARFPGQPGVGELTARQYYGYVKDGDGTTGREVPRGPVNIQNVYDPLQPAGIPLAVARGAYSRSALGVNSPSLSLTPGEGIPDNQALMALDPTHYIASSDQQPIRVNTGVRELLSDRGVGLVMLERKLFSPSDNGVEWYSRRGVTVAPVVGRTALLPLADTESWGLTVMYLDPVELIKPFPRAETLSSDDPVISSMEGSGGSVPGLR